MSGNSNLHKAKNDEFYTRYEDIEKELVHYKDELFGKTIYCPCDDYRWSEFPKFFKDKFKELGLKKVISTNYDLGDGAWCWTYDGKEEKIERLQGDGDYNSSECIGIRDSSDIICTNPPFSKIIDFFNWLDKDKKFLIIGNMNAICCKDIFPKIKDNKMWIGATNYNNGMMFRIPDDCTNYHHMDGTIKIGRVSTACWFTNVVHKNQNTLKLKKSYQANPSDYPKYDNYDAIEVSKVSDIPYDYSGVMGVPITVLKYLWSDGYLHFEVDPDDIKFGIVGIGAGNSWANYPDILKSLNFNPNIKYGGGLGIGVINGKAVYTRLFIRRKFEIIGLAASHGKIPKHIPNESAMLNGKWTYSRLLIKPEEEDKEETK